jgi:RING-box protein 1
MEQVAQTSKVCKLLKMSGVALWVYDSVAVTCGICKNPLNESCITCNANQENLDERKCQKVTGKCNHSFHCHCIENWIKKQNNCPMDFYEWMPVQYFD